jgi:putative ABC transport system substrate-binding protein
MKRREFITLLGGAAATWPVAARAQQRDRVRWIGVLFVAWNDDRRNREITEALEQSLASLGWTVGRNLAIDYRWGVNDFEKARFAVGQILRLRPDAILATGGPALMAAQQATATVPIVFAGVSEPVEREFVASLSRPGGNITGFTNLEDTMGGKWLELLKQMVPPVARVTAVFNPASSFVMRFMRSAEAAADRLGVELVAVHVTNPREIEAAVTSVAPQPQTALSFRQTVSHQLTSN